MLKAMNTTIDVTSGGGTHTRIKYEDDYTQEEHDVANTMITMQQATNTMKIRNKCLEMAGGIDVVMLYITESKHYKDIITQNSDLETLTCIWVGQSNQIIYDEIVKKANLILYYWRLQSQDEFKFLGNVIKKKVIQERNETNTLKMEFIISKRPDILPYFTKVPFYDYKANNDIQKTKSKKYSFEMLGLKPRNQNWTHGIMVGY